MRERIARAIEASMFASHELPISAELHELYLEVADAAIGGMRKLTPAMSRAIGNALNDGDISADPQHIWNAGIDAALAEKEPKE